MGKLGLVISIASGGMRDVFSVNVTPDNSRMIIDLRNEFTKFNAIYANNQLIRVAFLDTGFYITSISLITGRDLDYKSSWVFFPYELDINGKEMIEILDFTRRELSGSRINEERLNSFFSKEYPTKTTPFIPKLPKQSDIAYRYYGGDTFLELYELLGPNLIQSYYLNYNAVYLIDKNEPNLLTCSGDNFTGKKVREIVIVSPPTNDYGFDPYLDNRYFSAPLPMMEGDVVNISWRKNHYKTVEKQWQVNKENSEIPSLTAMDIYYQVYYTDITVIDDKGQKIKDYSLYVDHKQFYKEQNLFIHEPCLKSCEVTILAEGYKNHKKALDLSKPVTITLERMQYVYRFAIPLSNELEGEWGDMELELNYKLSKTPIEGYHTDYGPVPNKRNKLYYKPILKKPRLLTIILSLVALFLGFCGGFYVADLINDNVEKSEQSTSGGKHEKPLQSTQQPTEENEVTSVLTAIEYLDSNDVWMRSVMEDYQEMKGLWDALNERKFDDILGYKQKLSDSHKFQEVIQAVNKNKHKSFPQYYDPKPNAEKITIDEYIIRLNNAPEPGNSTPPQTRPTPRGPNRNNNDNTNNRIEQDNLI